METNQDSKKQQGTHAQSKDASKAKQQRHKKKAPELTPEQKAAALKAAEARLAEQKAEEARLNLLERNVKKMSHRQLRGELRRFKSHSPLDVAEAVALMIVLDGTRTSRVFEADENGKPTRVARFDQINQLGRLHAYPV